MNIEALYSILRETTFQFRKGEVIHGSPGLVDAINRGDEHLPGGVVSFDMMPHQDEAPDGLVKVDLHFITVGVDAELAGDRRDALIAILNNWPDPEMLAGGPSYITVGGTIGDQGAAFQLFALGEALKLWKVITPASFGVTGQEADDAAGSGFVMITGYRPGQP